MGLRALNTLGFTDTFSPLPNPLRQGEGAIQISVENALLTGGSRPPPQPAPCQGEGVNSCFGQS